jgi:two-component system invasion response regulator UvrY
LLRELKAIVGHGHPHVRAGLRQILLEEGMAAAVAEAGSADEMKALLKTHQWNVIVLGASFPGPPLQEQLAVFRHIDPSVRCVVLSGYPQASVTAILMECGADAVVLEDRIDDDLIAAVQSVRRGEYVFCRGLVEDSTRLAAGVGEGPPESALSSKDRKRVKHHFGSTGTAPDH